MTAAIIDASDAIKILNDRAADLLLELNPLQGAVLGIEKLEDEIFDVSVPARTNWIKRVEKVIEDARGVEGAGGLGKKDKMDLEFLKEVLGKAVGEFRDGFGVELGENHLFGFIMNLEVEFASYQKVQTPQDFANYKTRLSKIPSRFTGIIQNLRLGIARNITLPLFSVDLLIAKCASSSFEGYEGDALRQKILESPMARREEARRVMGDEGWLVKDLERFVVGTFERVKRFLVEEYREHVRVGDGIFGLEGYKKAYESYIYQHCSVRYTAEQAHQIGLSEVNRIHARMEQVKNRCGFDGTVKEFQNAINDRKRFPELFFENPDEEVIPFYAEVMALALEKMKTHFGRFPKFECGIKALPKELELQAPIAMYMPGTPEKAGDFQCNMRLHRTKPHHMAAAVCLHEASPGHHHQISLALENTDQHLIRKMVFESACVEGYGLYCEYLGEELDLYRDDFELFGRLEAEMQRACRLVVDSGLHGKGWTVEDGVGFMMGYLSAGREEVLNEVRRYCVMPGQALSYKIGEMKIRELRRRAERALEERFDVKEFHGLLLDQGSLPLGALEVVVDDYIASKKALDTTIFVGEGDRKVDLKVRFDVDAKMDQLPLYRSVVEDEGPGRLVRFRNAVGNVKGGVFSALVLSMVVLAVQVYWCVLRG
ncbi:hypothetical protein HDU97_006620 [Phlyctochytrium planicorne]|nr:hypothetical protein HDU97_006620 [Phlyctochytrium planicorne]